MSRPVLDVIVVDAVTRSVRMREAALVPSLPSARPLSLPEFAAARARLALHGYRLERRGRSYCVALGSLIRELEDAAELRRWAARARLPLDDPEAEG